MHTLLRYFTLCIAVVALALAGCEGAEGPMGARGETGQEGPGGPQGPQGPPGSANVTVETFSFAAADLEADGLMSTYTQEIEALDSAAVDSGNVMAFIERFEGGAIASASVDIQPQNSADGASVTVASAFLPQGGFVAIHDSTLLAGEVAGSVIGVSEYFEPGLYTDIPVTLFADVLGGEFTATTLSESDAEVSEPYTIIAMPHLDTNDNDTYDFLVDNTVDGPYIADGGALVDVAEVTAGADAEVTLNDQTSADSLTITVASVYLPQDGFVAVHDTSLLSGVVAGSVIGVSDYLEAGTYADVEIGLFDVPGLDVPADTTLPGTQAVIAMPHLDTDGDEIYGFLNDNTVDGPFLEAEGDRAGMAVIDSGVITVGEGGGDESALRASGSYALPSGFTQSLEAPTSAVNGNEGSVWVALPYTLYMDTNADGEAEGEVQVRFSYDYGAMMVEFASASEAMLDNLGGEYSIKAVIVPPGAEDGNASALQGDYATYSEAAKALGLPLGR